MDNLNDPPKRKRGRPKKSEVVSSTRGNRGTIGRPKGDAAIINEYKARMLASPKSRRVLETIFDAALDNDHKNQAAAWKLVMDRTLPLSYFEKDAASGRSSVNITISGLGGNVETNVNDSDIEGEIVEQDV
jgi:hypothetical protein